MAVRAVVVTEEATAEVMEADESEGATAEVDLVAARGEEAMAAAMVVVVMVGVAKGAAMAVEG